nr:F-box protein At5g49610-like isoform X1 [Setaria viridis]
MSTATSDGGRGIHALCDDALMEILVLLPNKSVLCCRAVCRRWRRITNDGSFLAGLSARRPLKMIILSQSGAGAVSAVSLSVDDPTSPAESRRSHLFDRRQLYEDGRTRRNNRCFDVVCSLDGLLVLSQRPGLFVVCNPATRQWTNLPALRQEPRRLHAIACGFYSHGSSGEYRLLCHVEYRRKRYYYILAAGGALPRRLGRAPRPPSWEYDAPVARRGILHWLASHPEAATAAGKNKMLAFDTASETFQLMPRPPERAGDTARALLELDGELSVAVMQGLTSLAVWDLRHYDAEVWTLRCLVVVEVPLSRLSTCRLHSVGGGAILIANRYSCKFNAARLYDLKEKRMLGEISLSHEDPTFLMFRESLVSHAFFHSPPRSSEVAYIKFTDYMDVQFSLKKFTETGRPQIFASSWYKKRRGDYYNRLE